MSEATQALMSLIAEINLAYQHKPFNPSTEKHQAFLKSYLQKTKQLSLAHPYLNLKTELQYFETGMKSN